MPRNKRPVPRKSNNTSEPDTGAQARALAELALEMAEDEEGGLGEDEERAAALLAAIRKALRRKNDELLYEAIEVARFTDPAACRLLRGRIEEEAATLRLRREGAPEFEIDAFLVPIFVRSTGGMVAQECFVDEPAYEALLASFKEAGLDSAAARVALIRHAYDLAEIDHVAFSTLHEMLREAAASLTEKKLVPAPVLEASMRGWTGERFGPDEVAMELRFLLGFSLKRVDDPFYQVPADEAGADLYFAARLERFREWTALAAPLVRRCLAAEPDRLTLNFLYQDLFYGAKEQGVAELATLGTLSELSRLLADKDLVAGTVQAVVAPLDAGDHIVLRVNLYSLDGGAPWGGVDKPVDLAADLGADIDDLCDALSTLGLGAIAIAEGFSEDGHPEGAEPYHVD